MAYNEQNIRLVLSRLLSLQAKLSALENRIQFEINQGKSSSEQLEVIDAWSKVKNIAQDIQLLVDGISIAERGLNSGDVPDHARKLATERLERNKINAEKKTKSAKSIEAQGELVYNKYKNYKGEKKETTEEKKEVKKEPKPKTQKKSPPKAKDKVKQQTLPKPKTVFTEPERAVKEFNKTIPSVQRAMYDELMQELKRLDLKDGNIKTTVANLRIINGIKNKLTNLILTDDYIDNVKDFVKSFGEVTKLQNEYWKSVESTFKPGPLLKEIRSQAISDTVRQLTGSGIGANISDKISDVLRTNITSGGSYKSLEKQLRGLLIDTDKSHGILTRYAKQITTDSINQYSAQYSQVVSTGLGFEWYAYRGTEIKTSREFCQAMVENRRHFHVSEVPALLRAEGLQFVDNKDGKTKKVRINPRTNLPYGFIDGTNPANFFINRGGYQCGHQISGVPERNVPLDVRDRVYNTLAYQQWKSNNG